ncbi:adenosylcobinamide-GDP ribazoletransferase [Nocardioides massiliensis]|uniref:Adenosylcobinamide-GDP ribazoletransferase n=1 Tax=Nocardioides massiliensis TaxID=1325935 RepID=A0ABT9NU02_9ACTN|nr:adenosylcobinamide-GDP ribazoletransferase [Nocardioides massiliensis]MDP9823913.1 adenosylcobinamide-GDP ribazoletransferase [Nocardioides massiliensis]
MDALRLAVGTLTVLRVPAPRAVDARTFRVTALLAPLAVVPLGLAVLGVGLLGAWLGAPAYVVAVVAVGVLALGTRILHLDGLSDTVDGLSASYDPECSLAVMRGGTAGPAGVVALVLVLGLQIAALAPLLVTTEGAVVAGIAVCVSRGALALCCLPVLPAARPDGLGVGFAGSVSALRAAVLWLALLGVLTGALGALGLPWWHGVVAVAMSLVAAGLLLARVRRRFGGVTGDVFGAAIEIVLTVLLVVLVVLAGLP